MINQYQTSDLSEAAALLACKLRLIQIERKGKKCSFAFEDQQKCKQVSNEFFFGELLLNAREYYQAFTLLKNRVCAGS